MGRPAGPAAPAHPLPGGVPTWAGLWVAAQRPGPLVGWPVQLACWADRAWGSLATCWPRSMDLSEVSARHEANRTVYMSRSLGLLIARSHARSIDQI
jgi:hypothetical protein